jgi:CRP-like cAMP-binding protein
MSFPGLEQTLKRHLSIPAIEEIVQKITFLRRIALSASWQPHSIARFAKCSRFESVKEGRILVASGRENRAFHIVHEGGMIVRHRGRRKAVLRGGEFLGEISMLLNMPSTADIVADGPGRCLVLQKSDFLALMGGDVELALQMEEIASRRFGRPVFPFRGAEIESLAN